MICSNKQMKHISKQIYQTINDAKNVFVVIHKNPDGDALGSGGAIFEYLKLINKKATFICSTEIPENLKFLPHYENVKIKTGAINENCDLLITLDSGDLEYTGLKKENLNQKTTIINIDHHKTNSYYGKLNLIDEDASSTCEIVYHFFKFNNIKINKNQATSILTGIITDTNNFTNSATTTTSLMVAGEMLRGGANLSKINTKILKNKNINSLKLWGTALSRLEKHPEIDLAHTHLTQKDFIKHNTNEDETDGISNFLNNLQEAKIALVLKETSEGKIKGSLRTTHDDIDVSVIAQKLGGGGHKKAAGFTTEYSIEEILKKIALIYKEINN